MGEYDISIAQLRSEMVGIQSHFDASVGQMHEKINGMGNSLTEKIHAVDKAVTELSGKMMAMSDAQKQIAQAVADTPSKGQFRILITVTSGLILAVVAAAAAVLYAVPKG